MSYPRRIARVHSDFEDLDPTEGRPDPADYADLDGFTDTPEGERDEQGFALTANPPIPTEDCPF